LSLEEQFFNLRKDVKEKTLKIIELANERNKIVLKIAKLKKDLNIPVKNKLVEEELRKAVLELCRKKDGDQEFSIKLLEILIDESIKLQEKELI